MTEERIKRKDLWQAIGKIRQNDWGKAAQKLGLDFSNSWGRGSHGVIRDPKFPDPSDTRGFITTIQKNLGKQHNQRIFKQLLDYGMKLGINEDDIWKALGML